MPEAVKPAHKQRHGTVICVHACSHSVCKVQALLEGIEQGKAQWRALPLILQRTVMVAMKALCQEGLSSAAPSQCPQSDTWWTALPVLGMHICHSTSCQMALKHFVEMLVCYYEHAAIMS